MQLNAVYFHAPLVGSVVKHSTQLVVDGVARGEGLVKFEFTDDVTQGGLREFLDSVGQIADFIHRLEWVNNLEIEQRVDLHLNVILGDNVLLVKVINLLAKVNLVGVDIASVGQRDDSLSLVDKRDDDVDTWL